MNRLLIAVIATAASVGVAFASPASADYTNGEQAFPNELGGAMPYPDATMLKLGYKICSVGRSMDWSDIAHEVATKMRWPLQLADTFDLTAMKHLCPETFAAHPGVVYDPNGNY